MRIHLVRKETIETYIQQNSQSWSGLTAFLNILKYADWSKPGDIKQTFPSADLLGNGSSKVVFDIGGNKYRLIVKYAFGEKQVHLFICWIGTHADYTKLCKSGLQFTIYKY